MRYITYYDSILGGLSDVDVHPDKATAIKFYRTHARSYFDVQLPSRTITPTACGFFHRQFGIMSIRAFRKRFPEWEGGTK